MVYLEDSQYIQLKKESEKTKRRMADIIRDALARYFRRRRKNVDFFSIVGIAEGPPNGRTSEQVEEILRRELR